MPYVKFPWFKELPVKSILNLEGLSPGHFYWPDVDADFTDEMIELPERFPLEAKST